MSDKDNVTENAEKLDEVKASMGDESMANDPVPAAGGNAKGKNRKADMNKSVDPKADEIEDDVKTPQADGSKSKAPARKADKAAVKEAVEEIFNGQDLSEDFKGRASVVFEAVVNQRIAEEAEMLEEAFEARLDEQVGLAIEELAAGLDGYLNSLAESWMEKNAVAVDRGIKAEMAESLMDGLKSLFTEHNIDVSEEKVDAMASVTAQLEETEERLNEALNKNVELNNELSEAKQREAFDEITEGLTDTQVEKIKTLSENVDFTSVSEYREKVSIIKENFVAESVKTADNNVVQLDEEIEADAEVTLDPVMSRYAEAISKNIGK